VYRSPRSSDVEGEAFERKRQLARRDVGTVRAHRAALAASPETLRLYTMLARETLARTPGRGKEEEILAVLEGSDSDSP